MKKYFPSKFDIPCWKLCGSSGFTLIEVMLVVLIILIAAGVTVPRFKGTFKSAQMTDAVRSTVRIARYARSRSILEDKICILRFEDRRIVLLCGETSEPAASRRLPDDIVISRFENLSGGDLHPDEARQTRFYPEGMNDGFNVTFSAGEFRRSTVVCNPVSGKTVVVEEGR